MPTYMYIRETSFVLPLKEQLEYAKEHSIVREHRLGPGQYARENCTDIRQLISHPLKAGDRLVVRNLLLIGHTHQKIFDTLQEFHRAKIQLEIIDANYLDLVPASGDPRSENQDYAKLTAFLRVFATANEKRKVLRMKADPSAKRGRPVKNWKSLPDDVKKIIIRHVENLYDYPESRAIMDIKDTGYSIGISTFRAVKKEYKVLLKQRRK